MPLTNKSNFAALSASMSSAAHDRDFRVSYSVGTVLGSLNIVNTVGSYGMQNLAGFPRSLGRFGDAAAGFEPSAITLSAAPEPASWLLFGVALRLSVSAG